MSDDFAGKLILVTGATGFLGGAVARRLASEGAQVRALARNPTRTGYIQGIDGIDIVLGDVTQAERMIEVTTGCHYVFHIAAATQGPMKRQRDVNVDGTRHIAQAMLQAGAERLVHISTIAAYGFSYPGPITEDLPLQPRSDPYNVTKAQGEAVLREMGQHDGLPYTILRPGMIYGPRSGVWTGQLFRLARMRPTPWIGNGQGSTQTIHVDDLIEQMLIQAVHPLALGEAFNSTPDPPPTWRDFIGAYAQLAGHDSWLAIPPFLGALAAPLIEAVFTLRGEPKDLPDLASYVLRRTVYSMDKARRLLDWEPRIDLPSGIESCAPWLREQDLLS